MNGLLIPSFQLEQSVCVCVHLSVSDTPAHCLGPGQCWSEPPGHCGVRPPAPAAPQPRPYLGQVKLSARASGADDQVLRKQEALPLALLLQGQGPQAPPGDLALLRHGHLDEGTCGWRRDPESFSQDDLCL